ncbi:hypothetical protein KKD52_18935, partial [Myxococcota bacterium]|nr:hypothetical protein [Myxococcota bacterium]MBU1512434.1 hypothetical protein [Myxococcota bacterium]
EHQWAVVRHVNATDDTEDVSIPFALQIGAGLMARFGFLNFGMEFTAISPGFSVQNDLVDGSLNFRIFVGFHVDSFLWLLLLPLAFA